MLVICPLFLFNDDTQTFDIVFVFFPYYSLQLFAWKDGLYVYSYQETFRYHDYFISKSRIV
jgi:hypothetical protein